VDEDALLAAIRRGELAGAALDVRQQEPPMADDLLKVQSRILSTPHIAGLTQEAGRRTALMVVEDVIRVLSGQPPLSSV
jgi:D-3-phosphoglycerate dehydrogenase